MRSAGRRAGSRGDRRPARRAWFQRAGRRNGGSLAEAAEAGCAPVSDALRRAYHRAFDAWITVSHLRFGPAETEDRAFALAFWPDGRGKTPKTLGTLIDGSDPVVATPEEFRTVSVAARGFYALEFLLYDQAFGGRGDADYRCALIRAMTADIAATSAAIIPRLADRVCRSRQKLRRERQLP